MIDLNGTLFAQILNFLILVAILVKVAYKPLLKTLAERQARIEASLETAEQERILAQELKKEHQAQLIAARSQAQAIVDKAAKLAEQAKEEILEVARLENARLLKAAQEEIARERELAVNQLKHEVVGISMLAASKIIGQNLDVEINAKLVAEFIEKLDEKSCGGYHVN
jgi:F-type H+-transporting ATPase subunit b